MYFDSDVNSVMCSRGAHDWIVNRMRTGTSEKTGRGPLYSASEKGRNKVVSLLLTLGHSPDRADVYGITPLQIAAWHGHCRVVRRLSERSSNVNKADRVGHSALFKAVWQGCSECADILIQHGANCNLQDKLGETPLMLEAALGCVRLIPQLLQAGARTDIQNLRGDTALHIAVCDGNYSFCRVLLEHGANPNICNMDGSTPLFYAVCRKLAFGAIECLTMLIRARADLEVKGREVNIDDGKSVSPFELAVLTDHPFGVLMLLNSQCNLSCMHRWMYNTGELPDVFRNNPRLYEHVKDYMSHPSTLRRSCRNVIRHQVHHIDDVKKLDLPAAVVDFLCLADLDNVSLNDLPHT